MNETRQEKIKVLNAFSALSTPKNEPSISFLLSNARGSGSEVRKEVGEVIKNLYQHSPKRST